MKKTVKNPPKWATYCITAGLLAVAAGIMMPLLLGLGNGTYKWVYAAGALVSLAGRVAGGYRGSEVRLKRLYRMEAWRTGDVLRRRILPLLRHGSPRLDRIHPCRWTDNSIHLMAHTQGNQQTAA